MRDYGCLTKLNDEQKKEQLVSSLSSQIRLADRYASDTNYSEVIRWAATAIITANKILEIPTE